MNSVIGVVIGVGPQQCIKYQWISLKIPSFLGLRSSFYPEKRMFKGLGKFLRGAILASKQACKALKRG